MESPDERRRRLYGPVRNLQVEEIRQRLSKSCVLKDGEYNFTSDKLRNVNYGTSYGTDFSGSLPDPSGAQEPKGQLEHHFELGNDSGAIVPLDTYQQSTTKADFLEKPRCKTSYPDMIADARIINWPDMAPRFMVNRKVGNSEYSSAFIPALTNNGTEAPDFPRLNTSKMQLPVDQGRFNKHRGTSITLGSDNPSIFSESQRVYGIGKNDGKAPSLAFSKEGADTGDVSKGMKDLERTSHVFRFGDYNGIAGNFQTTVNDEFGPRTLPPGEEAARAVKAAEKQKEDEKKGIFKSASASSLPDNPRTSHLAAYARDNIVPEVFHDAEDGKSYQTSAHFHLGYDPKTIHSIYAKDFALSAMAKRGPPKNNPTPAAGKLLQNDPAYSKFGTTSNQVDYSYTPAEPHRNAEGKTLMEVNMGMRDTDNIVMSYDPDRHTHDRQISLAHSDYIGPPAGYKPMDPIKRPRIKYDFLHTDDALPYPGAEKMKSEAKNNYIGTFMNGSHATERRFNKTNQTKQRLDDGRSTHFIVGYKPMDFVSETKIKYTGDTTKDTSAPAGKTENVAHVKFAPFAVSANTQDLIAADPHWVSNQESLTARMAHKLKVPEHTMRTSMMKADYKPLQQRGLTDAQVRTMADCEKKISKEIASAHLFHTDNSGRNNFVTTTMDDFTKPETMTGRKLLAAR